MIWLCWKWLWMGWWLIFLVRNWLRFWWRCCMLCCMMKCWRMKCEWCFCMMLFVNSGCCMLSVCIMVMCGFWLLIRNFSIWWIISSLWLLWICLRGLLGKGWLLSVVSVVWLWWILRVWWSGCWWMLSVMFWSNVIRGLVKWILSSCGKWWWIW